MTTELMPISGDIAPYNEFHAQVRQLKDENAKTVFDYEDPAGNKAARSYVHKLRQTKGAVEKTRKEEKAASLEYGRKVDAEAKFLTGEIDEMIEVHAAPLRAIEEREAIRIADIQRNIQHIVDVGNGFIGGEPQPFGLLFRELKEKIIIGDEYGEFQLEAHKAKEEAQNKLGTAFAEHQKREAEQAELAKLRAEKEERDRLELERQQKEREEKIAQEAAAKAIADAAAETQRKLEEAEQQKKAIADEADRREATLKLQAEEARREKAEAIQRERDRVAAEEKAKADEEARREASRKHQSHIHGDIIRALGVLGVSEALSKEIITAIRKGDVPRLKILY